jgi:tetratricopeptide (TPR) repeat protein
LRPGELKYVHSLSYYLEQEGDLNGAAGVWRNLIRQFPNSEEAYLALGKVLEAQGKTAEARTVYRQEEIAKAKGRPTKAFPAQSPGEAGH